MKDIFKEFKPSSWSIDNKTSIYVVTALITLAGIMSYINTPKEQFPEVVFPQILITTVYPGTSPTNMENLVSKQIEKRMKGINGVKKVTSSSVQDFSLVNVEFNTDVVVSVAKQKVKDEVDKAKVDLPNDLPQSPSVQDIDLSQMPIMNVHISGDYELDRLKKYAEDLKDKIEGLKEITRVDIVGALDREIQINLDMYKMAMATVGMMDVENAVKYENMTISGGLLDMGDMKRSINVVGQYTDPKAIENIVIRGGTGATVYLKDIAEVKDAYKEKESYARLDHKNVITLNVIKRSGENLIAASDKIREVSQEMQTNSFPKGLKVTITGDQSEKTRVTLHDLTNTIVIGFILVTLILMFFMGTTNAIFVAMSVPLSIFLAFLLMPYIGGLLGVKYTLNMIVLFALLLALGIVVDDAIVVIENTHRIFDNGKVPIKQAAKLAAGEVFVPVLAGTLTTLAPFIPLLAWKGIIGKFMVFLPATLIVTLSASLVVAYIINPVFAVDFMKPHHEDENPRRITRKFWITTAIFGAIAAVSYLTGSFGFANFIVFLYLLFLLNKFILTSVIRRFQTRSWPAFQNGYARLLKWFLYRWRPVFLLIGVFLLLIFTFALVGKYPPRVVFFPTAEPNFVYTYIKLPIGTDQAYTDKVTQEVENRIFNVVGENNPIVESIISNVAIGAGDPQDFSQTSSSNLGKVTVAFVEFAKRGGKSTTVYLDKVRESVKGIPGAQIIVDQEKGGPPTGKPISIEILGENFELMSRASQSLIRYLDSLQIGGVEELKSDLESNKPEIIVDINRERANREGISTAQIGSQMRNAVFGKEVSKFKDDNDEYPIQMRIKEDQRSNINTLMNMQIAYRDMNMGGMMRTVPLSAVAEIRYANTYGGIKRKNQDRLVTISSNVLSSYNPNQVVAQVKEAVESYKFPEGIKAKFGGEQEEQAETGAFLGWAMMAALGLIFLILVTQFNSVSKPLIILTEIIFSVIGVLLGFVIFKMDVSIIMTGIGIVALAGIVVRNGILLVEFTDILLEQGMPLQEAIIEAGRTRMTPVLLTASATILGLVPLAVGMNIDFVKMFTEFNPHLFFGGDSVAFWGPLSWTMIFGLSFATFLTLILVPAMILLVEKLKEKWNIKSAAKFKYAAVREQAI